MSGCAARGFGGQAERDDTAAGARVDGPAGQHPIGVDRQRTAGARAVVAGADEASVEQLQAPGGDGQGRARCHIKVVGADAGEHLGTLAPNFDGAGADVNVPRRCGPITLADQKGAVADGQFAVNLQVDRCPLAQASIGAGQDRGNNARCSIGRGRHVAAQRNVDHAAVGVTEGLREQTSRRQGQLVAPDEDGAARPIAREIALTIARVTDVDIAGARNADAAQRSKPAKVHRASTQQGITRGRHAGQAHGCARGDDGASTKSAGGEIDVATYQREGLAGRNRRR